MVYIDEHIDQLDQDAALPLLPEERKQKALAFKHELGRRQSVAVWLLLRRGCQEVFGLSDVPAVAFGEHGKPYFPEHPDLHFNLSHCREAVACAVDWQPVGIDIESVRRFNDRLARYVLSEEEYQQVVVSEQPGVAFARLWTMKESLLKLTGHGLASDMKRVLADCPAVEFETTVHPSQQFVCTVARYSAASAQ